MRVLHLLKSTIYSGAENVALTIMDCFPEDEMIYASPDGPIREVVERRGHKFCPLETASIGAVKEIIRKIKPDLVHAHDFSMASYAAWTAGKIPVVAHFHNNPLWLKKVCPQSIVLALSLPRINQVISVSDSIQNEYIFRKFLQGKNTVVGNVVNIEEIREKARKAQNCRNVDLVFLGRLTEQKCPLVFCQIVKETRKKLPGITAQMIGDGELMPTVRNYIYKNGLEHSIELMGFQSNPYPYLAAGKIMVMPSAWEGFGLAAVEGMCLGKPVVCSGVGGLSDIVDSSCGAICETKEEYAENCVRLLSNEDKYTEKSMNAMKKSKKFSDIEEYKQKIVSCYRKASS